MAFSRTVTEAGVIPVPVFRLYSYFTAGPVHPGPKDGSEAGIGPMGMVLLKGENKVIGIFPHFIHEKRAFYHRGQFQVIPVSIGINKGDSIFGT